MAERKVLNKYLPPDFDPSKVPKGRKSELGRCDIRMMLPMNVQCLKCGEFMYKGTKFNSKKEDVLGESYLGMKIFRFIMKCTRCNSLFSIKTDPKNADYEVEYGASRNFEPWREDRETLEKAKEEKEKVAEMDTMKSLELRTEDSLRQMEEMDRLEQLRNRRAQHQRLGLNAGTLLDDISKDTNSEPHSTNEENAFEMEARELFLHARSAGMKRVPNGLSFEEPGVKKSINNGRASNGVHTPRAPNVDSSSLPAKSKVATPTKNSLLPSSLLPSSIIGLVKARKSEALPPSNSSSLPQSGTRTPSFGKEPYMGSGHLTAKLSDSQPQIGGLSSLFAYGSGSESD